MKVFWGLLILLLLFTGCEDAVEDSEEYSICLELISQSSNQVHLGWRSHREDNACIIQRSENGITSFLTIDTVLTLGNMDSVFVGGDSVVTFADFNTYYFSDTSDYSWFNYFLYRVKPLNSDYTTEFSNVIGASFGTIWLTFINPCDFKDKDLNELFYLPEEGDVTLEHMADFFYINMIPNELMDIDMPISVHLFVEIASDSAYNIIDFWSRRFTLRQWLSIEPDGRYSNYEFSMLQNADWFYVDWNRTFFPDAQTVQSLFSYYNSRNRAELFIGFEVHESIEFLHGTLIGSHRISQEVY